MLIRLISSPIKLALLLLVLSCWAYASVATADDDQMSITVYVDDQSTQQRREAFKEAIGIAVKRLTNEDPSSLPVYKSIQASSSRYVRGFRYLNKGEADVEASRNLGVRKLLIKVDFNKSDLRSALNASQQTAFLNNNQHSVLFWVVESTKGSRRIISSKRVSTSAKTLKQYAKARGITAILPAYDASEQALVRTVDIVGGFDSNVIGVSKNYPADNIVSIHLEQEPSKEWRSSWTLISEDRERSKWLARGRNRTETINSGIQQLRAKLDDSASGSILISGQKVKIEIQNIDSFVDLAAVEDYMLALSSTESVALENIANKKALFAIAIRSDRRIFEKQLLRNKRFQQIVNNEFSEINPIDLTLQYQAP